MDLLIRTDMGYITLSMSANENTARFEKLAKKIREEGDKHEQN